MFNFFKQKLKSESYRQILLVTSLLLISRFFGLIRTSLIGSSYIGDSAIYSDIFISAQLVQDLLISILIMGTLISTITPTGSKLLVQNGEQYYNRYLRFNFWFFTFIFLLISLFVCIFVDPILKFTLTDRYNKFAELGLLNTFIDSARVLSFGVVFFAANTLLQTYLNIKNSFFWNNLSGILTNLFIIITIINSPKNYVFQVSIALVLSFIFSMFVHFYGAFRLGIKWSFFNIEQVIDDWKEFKNYLKEDLKVIFPKFFIVPLSLVSTYMVSRSTIIGYSTFYENSLNIQGVFLILITAIGMVILPKLSIFASSETNEKFVKRLHNYIIRLLPLGIAGTVFTFLFAKYILILVLSVSNFKKGIWSFVPYNDNEVLQVNIIRIMSFGILFFALNEIMIKYFMIKNQVIKLLSINTFCILLFFVILMILGNITKFENILNISLSYIFALSTQSLIYYLAIKFDYQQKRLK